MRHRGYTFNKRSENSIVASPIIIYNNISGEKDTEIKLSENVLTISYEGYTCRYTASGKIFDLRRTGAGRNGHYKAYAVSGKDRLEIKIEIIKKQVKYNYPEEK